MPTKDFRITAGRSLPFKQNFFAIGSLQQPVEWDTILKDSNHKQKYLGFQKELYKSRHIPVIAV